MHHKYKFTYNKSFNTEFKYKLPSFSLDRAGKISGIQIEIIFSSYVNQQILFSNKERRSEGKKERRKEGKKVRRKEGKRERRKEGKSERGKEGNKESFKGEANSF